MYSPFITSIRYFFFWFIIINNLYDGSYSKPYSGSFLSKNVQFRTGTDRQIQPLSCIGEATKEKGICMFAWNCVEAGGLHLGTCIDRFYFGSCCKLPNLSEENGIVTNEVVVENGLEYKKTTDSSTASSSTSTIETTSQMRSTTTTSTTSTLGIAPIFTSLPSSTEYPALSDKDTETVEETTTLLTTPMTIKTTPKTTSALPQNTTNYINKIFTFTSPATTAKTTISTKAVSNSSTTMITTPIPFTTVTHSEITTNLPVFLLPETTVLPVEVLITSTSKFTKISFTDDNSNSVSPSLIETNLIVDGSWTPLKPSSEMSEGFVEDSNNKTEIKVPFNELQDSNKISEALSKMSYEEACGRRPWFQVEGRESIYKDGIRNGPSNAPIGQTTPRRRNVFNRVRSHRNSKFLRSWRDPRGIIRKGRIVNGDTSDYGEWPWQISLRQWRTATYLHKCGCALLNKNWAITAAHCVENVSPDDLSLRMGEYDLNSVDEPNKFMDRKVQIVASHPKFDPKTFEYDLALLRFYEPVEFQPNIIPICVPDDDRQLVGETAWVTGWGRLYEDGPLPSVMQEVGLPIINNSRCEGMYKDAGYIEHIPEIFICAGYAMGGKDSCEGDSGGPMVVQREDGRFMLSGVISWGIGCAEKNQPGVYTRISEFKGWINQILQF